MRRLCSFLAVALMAVLVVLLAGCAGIRRGEAYRDALLEIRQHQAEILGMYKECLKRKSADPQVDCSEYRKAIEVDIQVK